MCVTHFCSGILIPHTFTSSFSKLYSILAASARLAVACARRMPRHFPPGVRAVAPWHSAPAFGISLARVETRIFLPRRFARTIFAKLLLLFVGADVITGQTRMRLGGDGVCYVVFLFSALQLSRCVWRAAGVAATARTGSSPHRCAGRGAYCLAAYAPRAATSCHPLQL